MSKPWIVVSGFGPFLDVECNPSRELARALRERAPEGVAVHGGELPVSVAEAGAAFDRLVDELIAGTPSALLALGVHRGPEFRLERRARFRLHADRPDNDGRVAAGVELEPKRDFSTDLDLERLEEFLREGGAERTMLSDDAGGYVCERVYHAVLARAERLSIPGLFLHVPPVDHVPLDRQLPVVESLVRGLVAQLRPTVG